MLMRAILMASLFQRRWLQQSNPPERQPKLHPAPTAHLATRAHDTCCGTTGPIYRWSLQRPWFVRCVRLWRHRTHHYQCPLVMVVIGSFHIDRIFSLFLALCALSRALSRSLAPCALSLLTQAQLANGGDYRPPLYTALTTVLL